MKKILLLSAVGLAFLLVACNKEADNDVSPSSSVGSISYTNDFEDNGYHGNGGGCNGGNQNDNNSAPLKVEFSVDNEFSTVDEQMQVKLTNQSSNAVSYAWDFGNGDTSTDANPEYSYKMHGNYTITLKATDARGKVQTVSHDVTVLCILGGGPHNF